ncbi:TIGR04283 family arsenosugar biosynthesis glycosyltransferase [Algoriphagus sp. NF]|uniref:TIGR04283 family arsenosugar biosynthesis glycosyltransferase n=1 Tax=Algoriphagus sp. NF TaxID=2992756 RepID=UPI00237C51A9|nr:TIGR04283 family arsenosugar biosynthesis glycosyltransferase [Algoriphagus sp. NF]MDE0561415.1 TIGR04283 family arsenosugar biosynthesis glycosyltransferase [Algoriphagus sp. NF]
MKLSVIIPTLNEEENLKALIPFLKKELAEKKHEIIVVDANSGDFSEEICLKHPVTFIRVERSSRAVQMNKGAMLAIGDTLYFVHADTRPVPGFFEDIERAVANGKLAGCYRYRFDSKHPLLKINSWFTRFNGILSGGGDQTLFIKKDLFDSLGGFNEQFCIMEDFELVKRIKIQYQFYIIPKSIKVSARKYENNSWLRVQWANLIAFKNFLQKRDPREIREQYYGMLKRS